MYALNLADDGRILSATYPKYALADAVTVDALPEGDIYDYRYVNGEYVYDPFPVLEPEEPAPTLEGRVSAVEDDVAGLTAAIEKGLSL